MSVRNEIKAQIVRAGFTMQEVVDRLHDEYDWSDSVRVVEALVTASPEFFKGKKKREVEAYFQEDY